MARQTQLERNAILESKIAHLERFTARMELDHASAMNAATLDTQQLERDLQARLSASEKNAESLRSNNSYYQRERDKVQNELNDLHTILDFLPGVPPRKAPTDEYGTVGNVALVARFAAFLATKP